jgi:predicted RNA-binding protein with PUA-like domain
MAHWLLQGNPKRWRIADFLAEHSPEELTNWSVTRYRDELQPGDDLALWRTGPDAGVIALGQVTGPVYEAVGAADEYWQDREQAQRAHWWLPLRLTEVFLDAPVTREELRHDPAFAQAAILRQPFAGNPFRLSHAEWTAILDRHQGTGPTGSDPTSSGWSLQPGDRIFRTDLHRRYGGSPRGGVCPSRETPNILIFTDRRSGERHGYYDEWAPNGSFDYTGHGQHGDQKLIGGNLKVLNHAKDGNALRVFKGAGGLVEYVGEFVVDDHEPFTWATAPSTAGGPPRQVIRFHLRPVNRPPSTPDAELGAPYQPLDETIEPASPTAPASADPDAVGRGWRAHRRLQNRLSELVRSAGYEPRRSTAADPDFDLAWTTPWGVVVVEVKSCTKANEVRQLRLGIGQVLDYEDVLRARGQAVQPALYLERAPSDSRWMPLANRHNIRLIWPGCERALFQRTSSPPTQRES